ncbi:MAG: hypothetical protein H7A21_13390 [Spirochaetales bacterium]|nr:hypothetical protein [Leptospiraceae bacterium]MCP5482423.1 hypothetical protein [Spirochaetales bacterium]MCP5485873.1 hypothetical protein [Spirochaetales bacterium]
MSVESLDLLLVSFVVGAAALYSLGRLAYALLPARRSPSTPRDAGCAHCSASEKGL